MSQANQDDDKKSQHNLPLTQELIGPAPSLPHLPKRGELPEPSTIALDCMLPREDDDMSAASTDGFISWIIFLK